MGPTPAKVGRIRLERNWVAPTQTPVLIPDCWYVPDKLRTGASNLGSVNAPPPLEHRQSGVGWSKKGIYDV